MADRCRPTGSGIFWPMPHQDSTGADPLISIVDDDRAVREAVQRMLHSHGFATAIFASAEDFLISQQPFRTSCLILDVRMPGMTGMASSVLLHLTHKAFYPRRSPLLLIHVDTTWKLREMIFFRDETAGKFGIDLIDNTNPDGLARGISPIASGSALHTEIMKTEA